MARFEDAYAGLAPAEGGYANDPDDPGGETFAGITRRDFPEWRGWGVIDARTAERPGEPPVLTPADFAVLGELAAAFYRAEFWADMQGDRLLSQAIASECFEASVNVGTTRAVRWLQRALNVCNRRATLWPDLVVDGRIGEATIAAVADAVLRRREGVVVAAMNILQGAHYVDLMERRDVNERFTGWFDRAAFTLSRGRLLA
ncbi:MAG: glycoside hydrolase family 108 protein [Gammaproteobacteria bacterium]